MLAVHPDEDADTAAEHPLPVLEKQKPLPPTFVAGAEGEFVVPFVPAPRLPPIFLEAQLVPFHGAPVYVQEPPPTPPVAL